MSPSLPIRPPYLRHLLVACLLALPAWSQPETTDEAPPSAATEHATPATAPAVPGTAWHPLWGTDEMPGWKVIQFGGSGQVSLTNGVLSIGRGVELSGLVYTNPLPRIDYEIELHTQRVSGRDFGCGLTFPVADACCTFIFGGWGGGVVGLSSIDGLDASENSTGHYRAIENGRWYQVRVRVERARIRVWLDGELIIHQPVEERGIGMRPGAIESCQPFGLATYQTVGATRGLRVRALPSSQ